MSDGALILIIDDEVQIRRLLRINLEANGYRTVDATTGQEGISQVGMARPDLIILDLQLPDMSGLEIVKKLREWNQTPIIILTVKNSEQDKIELLDAGADDYLTKPFGTGELLARIRTALRHKLPITQDFVFECSRLKIDFSKRIVSVDGKEIHVTPTEYSLLKFFSIHSGKIITHSQIMREVWGPNFEGDTNYLRVYVNQIRKKIELNPTLPEILITEPGVGYRLICGD